MRQLFKIEDIDEKLAMSLLEYECKLRKSDEIQDYYTFLKKSKKNNTEVVEDYVQFKTIRDFNYIANWDSINEYRKISTKFRGNKNVINSAFYLKYNIFTYGTLSVFDDAPNAELLHLTGTNCNLLDFASEKPLVIFAGSIS
jgi:hypothetical protein